MLQPLDGPAKQFQLTVNTTTPQELKRDTDPLDERKVITVQAINGKIWIYFADETETVTAGNVSSKGFLHFSKGKETYEASNTQKVYVLAFAGTVDVRGAERA